MDADTGNATSDAPAAEVAPIDQNPVVMAVEAETGEAETVKAETEDELPAPEAEPEVDDAQCTDGDEEEENEEEGEPDDGEDDDEDAANAEADAEWEHHLGTAVVLIERLVRAYPPIMAMEGNHVILMQAIDRLMRCANTSQHALARAVDPDTVLRQLKRLWAKYQDEPKAPPSDCVVA